MREALSFLEWGGQAKGKSIIYEMGGGRGGKVHYSWNGG